MSEYHYEQADRIRRLVLKIADDQVKDRNAVDRNVADRETINAIRYALDDVREIDRARRFNIYLFPAIIVILFVFVGGLVAGLEIGHAKSKQLPPVEHQPTPPVEQGATP